MAAGDRSACGTSLKSGAAGTPQTFLSATGTSITTLSLMRLVPSWRDRVERAGASVCATRSCEQHGSQSINPACLCHVVCCQYRNSPVGLPMTIVGAMLLGVGMTVGGACPGTVRAAGLRWPNDRS